MKKDTLLSDYALHKVSLFLNRQRKSGMVKFQSLLSMVGVGGFLLASLFLFHCCVATSNADWMSGKHGVGYRVPGGVNWATNFFKASDLRNQIENTGISYVIVGLSSGAFGDRYLAPHPILTSIGSRATTPKHIPSDEFVFAEDSPSTRTFPLDDYPDLDVFDDLLTEMEKINVKVIAYMAAQGPALLKATETAGFDYGSNLVGFNTGGYFVDSFNECLALGVSDGNCSPSVRKWVAWVAGNHSLSDVDSNFSNVYVQGTTLQTALKTAYADVIVDYYAKRYGNRIAGFWFDQGNYKYVNKAKIVAAVRRHNPTAAIGFSGGYTIPLRNSNPGEEDFTYGHVTPIKSGQNVPDGCYNYGMVLSAEHSINGYVYPNPTWTPGYDAFDLTKSPKNPYADPNFTITYTEIENQGSLAHVFMPANELWNSGDLVWNTRQATEWMRRVLDAGGAWTWNIRRTGCSGCEFGVPAKINPPDMVFLNTVYAGLPNGASPISADNQFNGTNCDCQSRFKTTLGWGCNDAPPPPCENNSTWFHQFSPTRKKDCFWICKGAHIRCPLKNPDGVSAYIGCPSCCDSCPEITNIPTESPIAPITESPIVGPSSTPSLSLLPSSGTPTFVTVTFTSTLEVPDVVCFLNQDQKDAFCAGWLAGTEEETKMSKSCFVVSQTSSSSFCSSPSTKRNEKYRNSAVNQLMITFELAMESKFLGDEALKKEIMSVAANPSARSDVVTLLKGAGVSVISISDPEQYVGTSLPPSSQPSDSTSSQPSDSTSSQPSDSTSSQPSDSTSSQPSDSTSSQPSFKKSLSPSDKRSAVPSYQEIFNSTSPSSLGTSMFPSYNPSSKPSLLNSSSSPSLGTTSLPPSSQPSDSTSSQPSDSTSSRPSFKESLPPSDKRSDVPSYQEIFNSTSPSSLGISMSPSDNPSHTPSLISSYRPSLISNPSLSPVNNPSLPCIPSCTKKRKPKWRKNCSRFRKNCGGCLKCKGKIKCNMSHKKCKPSRSWKKRCNNFNCAACPKCLVI